MYILTRNGRFVPKNPLQYNITKQWQHESRTQNTLIEYQKKEELARPGGLWLMVRLRGNS